MVFFLFADFYAKITSCRMDKSFHANIVVFAASWAIIILLKREETAELVMYIDVVHFILL